VPQSRAPINVGHLGAARERSPNARHGIWNAVTLNFGPRRAAVVAKVIKVYRSFAARAFKSKANRASHIS
jgi:hypothetical protein